MTNETRQPDIYLMGSHVVGYTFPLGEYIEDQWKRGALRRVNADGTAWAGNEYAVPAGAVTSPSGSSVLELGQLTAEVPGRPKGNASRKDWAAYAVEIGAASFEQAEQMTRDEIIDLTTPPEMKPGNDDQQ